MRICYISRLGIGTITENRIYGGGEILNLNEAKELAKDKRFDVHLLVEGDKRGVFKHENITVWVILRNRAHKDLFEVYRAFKKINADIYYRRSSTSRAQWVYEPIICKLLGKKYIYNEVGDPKWFVKSIISQVTYRTCLALADAIIAHSQLVEQSVKAFTRRKIRRAEHTTIVSKPMKLQRKHILWVGRTEASKRMDLFIELAKRFSKENFLMLIRGEQANDLPSNVKAVYNVPYTEVDKYYAQAKMVVQTTDTEGFGTVYLESWKNKTPVVSLTVDPDGIITKYNAGLLSGNFEQMVKDVKMLLADRKKWKEISENGYKYAIENHDIKKVIEQYKKVFFTMLPGQSYISST